MRYPKLRELREAIKALIKGPYTSRFPYRPHEPAERFRGRPYFYEKDCIGCGACFQVCPARAIEMQDVGDKRVLTLHWDLCIYCGQCQANCVTSKGIMLSREFDISTTGKRQELKDTIEKKLIFCDCCGDSVGPLDQILWLAQKLGPLVFSNVSTFLFYLTNLGLAFKQGNSAKKGQDLKRSDRFKILCPRCRRQAVLKS
jgi:hydrogenase-4 component H